MALYLPKTRLISEVVAGAVAGVPAGGSANTSLTKISVEDFDTQWSALPLRGVTVYCQVAEPTDQQTNDIWIKI